jgi:hypothetical protein
MPEPECSLPKRIVDRIHRYAAEGRALRVRYGSAGGLLLALKAGSAPLVVFRETGERFVEMRSTALIEWFRAKRNRSSDHCS